MVPPGLSAPISHVTGTFRLTSSFCSLRHMRLLFSCWLADMKRNISHLLLPQFSGSQGFCWLRRKFFTKAPISHWFPKTILSSSKITAALPVFKAEVLHINTPAPTWVQIHVQHMYLYSSYLQHSVLLSPSTGRQTLDFKHPNIFADLDRVHQSIVCKPQQSLATEEHSYFSQKYFMVMSLGLILLL